MRCSLFLLGLAAIASASAQTAPAPAGAPNSPVQVLPQVDVTGRQQEQLNAIDRKTYFVGQDVQGVAGSAADILQNIPSVDVDVDGNVSLRGDASVQVLINGRTSSLMKSSNRADVLSQLPASSIERIEVITNPSAMYKPDGSAGIINIVLKKNRAPGLAGSVRLSAGTQQRYGGSVGANFNPGSYNLGASLGVRQDDRERIATDQRAYIDPVTGQTDTTQSVTREHNRPWYEFGQSSVEDDLGDAGRLAESVDYTYRTQDRHADETIGSLVQGSATDYDRLREDREYERDVESRTTFDHDFGRKDDTLSLEFRWEHDNEFDRNLYTDVYSLPATPSSATRTNVGFNDPTTEILAEYSNVLGSDRKLELGFDRQDDWSEKNVFSTDLNPATNAWIVDPTITNDFIVDQTVTALYGTFRQRFGNFSIMPGLRLEATVIHTNQVTQGIMADQSYYRAYPTLHTAYDLSPAQQLQLNYSERINRPDPDDLNPFSEYQDPTNLREGNPHLHPEVVQSLEAGDQYKRGDDTYLAALFYKYTDDSFTTVSQIIDSTTLVTTQENLSHTQSGGLETAATTSPWKQLTLNASASAYWNQIDASNLGYSAKLSTYTWSGKLSAEYTWNKSTALQLSANYTAKRLTPQGARSPTFVSNLGLKRELSGRHLTLFLAVSDLFNTLRDETVLNTPTLRDVSTRRRNARYFYGGLVYTFGSGKKKPKSEVMQFDN